MNASDFSPESTTTLTFLSTYAGPAAATTMLQVISARNTSSVWRALSFSFMGYKAARRLVISSTHLLPACGLLHGGCVQTVALG